MGVLTMIVALDVLYGDGGRALVGAVGFGSFEAVEPSFEMAFPVDGCAEYEPGAFYKRELPCLLAALSQMSGVEMVIVDGYVDLDVSGRAGLGRKLWEALGERVPVIGVAKRPFHGIPKEWELLRGKSANPLLVTAAGMDLDKARAAIASMSGEHRMPTLLRRVDQLSRGDAPQEVKSATLGCPRSL